MMLKRQVISRPSLSASIALKSQRTSMKKLYASKQNKGSVLVLGAGLVTAPLVEYLNAKQYDVTVASRTLSKIEAITNGLKFAKAVACDCHNEAQVADLVQKHDVVVSMLPFIHHKLPFDLCLKYNKHFLSTSYTQDHMKERAKQVVEKGLIVVNEAGLYPGLETASIMKEVVRLEQKGYKVNSLTTFCGGIPAPEANDNPFGYKFSWAPRGVLLAERNGATFLENGKILTFDTRMQVFGHSFWEDFGGNIGKLEGIANRDSVKFIDLYRIQGAETFIRGTLRYPGWTDIIKFMSTYGLLDITPVQNIVGKTYLSILANALKVKENEVESFIQKNHPGYPYEAMKFLNVFDPKNVVRDDLAGENTNLDAFASLMKQHMVYKEGERDMIPMVHRFKATNTKSGDKMEVVSKAIFYGNETGTAMENTVSLPVAVVADLILSKKFIQPGVHILSMADLFEPILEYMATLGYTFEVTERKTK